jgi:AAA domain-containing protein
MPIPESFKETGSLDVLPDGMSYQRKPPLRVEPDPGVQLPQRLSGRSIADFLDLKIDPLTNVLGSRFLTIGSGMFLIAPSGHGKSSFSIQLLISFAIGRSAFGIKPRPGLRILFIQSEDDDAETKKFAQVIRKMNLTKDELKRLKENTRFEYRNDLTGDNFLAALDSFCSEWPPDLIIINPFTGFLLADLKDEEKISMFLRGRLNPILTKYSCAAIIVHHTPKTNFSKLENMQWYDWMYAMSGCASLTNWARAVLVLAPSKLPGTYRLIAAKRFDELGWTDRECWFSHSKETITLDGKNIEIISWVPATAEQICAAKPAPPKDKKKSPNAEMVWKGMSPIEPYTRDTFQDWALEKFDLGANLAWNILKTLRDQKLVQVTLEKRPGTNPLKWYQKLSASGVDTP